MCVCHVFNKEFTYLLTYLIGNRMWPIEWHQYRRRPWVTLKVMFAVWNLPLLPCFVKCCTNLLRCVYAGVGKRTGLVISNVFCRNSKDFSRSQAVTCTVNVVLYRKRARYSRCYYRWVHSLLLISISVIHLLQAFSHVSVRKAVYSSRREGVARSLCTYVIGSCGCRTRFFRAHDIV